MSGEKVIPIDDISLDLNIYDGSWNQTLVEEHIKRMNDTLHALQQNADNFYFIVLAILIFGNTFHYFTILKKLLIVIAAIQVGFIFMEVGLVRTKNVTNVLVKCLLDTGIFSIRN